MIVTTSDAMDYRVLATYPHDVHAFTQGLIFADGQLWESTGRYGYSSLRRVELTSGQVLQSVRLPANVFAEGLAQWGNCLIQLTWRAGIALVYDRTTLKQITQFNYQGEGWGLTSDGQYLIMSDGTAQLRWIDPVTYQNTGQIEIRDGKMPLTQLNELEYINGEVWANVYGRDAIVRIDPLKGTVRGWLDLTTLYPKERRPPTADVMNGIAYDPATQRLFVTGKYWPLLFVLELIHN
ncbi:glutaminyl-peptide cyclotransferase [Thiospirillum jenense]|uniref:Glutaminyl-peptide cyclotransferase n=1 Tax=Thiospirillum jenense TaxID=1653858 RepID=A0A839HKE0_9GAMM|nr:glutaminyl-peptide cyclotransferase [Thiospirillum jenense]MBB1126949.1 glutaminyl-peptide cyclotransferase [Thiospirillum jenense]